MADQVQSDEIPGRRLLVASRFRYLWAGQIVSQAGDGLNKIALLWFVYHLTGSPLEMTVIGVLQSLPPLLLSPFIGVFIDRLPKKLVLISTDLTRAVLVTLIPLLYALGLLNLPLIYVLTFINATVAAAFGPTMAAAIPRIVKSHEYTAANGLIHSATTTGVLVGPALGGLLTAFMGAQNVLYIDAATFIFSAGCLSLLKLSEKSEALGESLNDVEIVSEIKQGLLHIFLHRPIISWLLLASAFFAAGVGAFPILLPIFAKAYLGVGSVWLGWLWSGLGAGMVIVTTALAALKNKTGRTSLLIMGGGSAVAALAVAILTIVPGPWFALALIAIIGASTAMFTPLLWTMLQRYTCESLRGRVFTLVGTASMAASTLSMALVGVLAEYMGPGSSLLALAVMFFGVALVIGVLTGFCSLSSDMTDDLASAD